MTVKIDWSGLMQQSENDQEAVENSQKDTKSRENPDFFYVHSKKSVRLESSSDKGLKEFSRLSRLSRLKNEGGGIISDEASAPEGLAARESRVENLHPIAVCLLLSVAKKIRSEDEEILYELVKLETMKPVEQIKTWARYAVENGIDSHRVIYPFIQSPGKGNDCTGCQHLDMTCTSQPGKSRKVYQWQCKKQHQILEACYLRERLLIAPVDCTDYQKA